MLFAGDVDAWVDEIEEFVTGARPPTDTNRVLVTVLFTDIVSSSQRGPSWATASGEFSWTPTTPSYAANWRATGRRERPLTAP